MPFTFCHPAIVLPLNRFFKKWVSLTGLIIGSLTPDFEYFIRMKIVSEYSHSILGVFLFNLPIGVLLAFLYHNLVKESLVNNLPDVLKKRLVYFINFKWNVFFKSNWFIVCLSVLIGAFSHILWDSFTHQSGFFVNKLDLKTNLNIFNRNIPVYKLLQHLSSLIGGGVIIYSVLRLPKKTIDETKPSLNYWLTIILITLFVSVLRFFCGLEIRQYGNVIVTILSAFMIGLIITPLMKNYWEHRV